MRTTPKNHNKEVIYNNKGNPRQPQAMLSATPSDIPIHPFDFCVEMAVEMNLQNPDIQCNVANKAKFTAQTRTKVI